MSLPDVPVTLSFPNGSSETRQTTSSGLAYFTGFDASGGVTVSVELPASYSGYTLISCPNSPTSIQLQPDDFQFRHKTVRFGAKISGESANP